MHDHYHRSGWWAVRDLRAGPACANQIFNITLESNRNATTPERSTVDVALTRQAMARHTIKEFGS